jgi:hypothetical protein
LKTVFYGKLLKLRLNSKQTKRLLYVDLLSVLSKKFDKTPLLGNCIIGGIVAKIMPRKILRGMFESKISKIKTTQFSLNFTLYFIHEKA